VPFTFYDFLNTSISGYTFKFAVALAVTPVLYGMHGAVHHFLGPRGGRRLRRSAGERSRGAPIAGPPTRGRTAGGSSCSRCGALGVVYGDIGTSPLYALRECSTASTRWR
jgi:hypothetical protein